jgi:alginate O-acetyltransferase complex protein AlgI
MQFQSFVFLQFFLLFYSSYLLLMGNLKAQNIVLIIASYIFYGYWDWRFLILLILSTAINFAIAILIEQNNETKNKKNLWLGVSLLTNLSILGFFKYFNFFTASFTDLLHTVGIPVNDITLKVILPVGISFYTFQTLSYTVDVYRQDLKASRNLLNFAIYIAFFPQLVAGPIERATSFLPQISKPRKIQLAQINAGIFLIIWGYFKKLVIADNLAQVIDPVFNNYTEYQGLDIILAILAFTVQIYCDFSAYSDIARGLAKLMGFELMINFKLPFFALNPSDFWSRWHISLSSWLKDYLYIPLGGNRQGEFNTYRNLFLTMLIGGLWHGAAWNFVWWGIYQGLILIVYRWFAGISKQKQQLQTPVQKPAKSSLLSTSSQILLMFILANIGWVIFRSTSVEQIIYLLTNWSLATSENTANFAFILFFFTTPLLLVQLWQHLSQDLLIITKLPLWLTNIVYGFFLIGIFLYGVRESTEFIYFQF